MIEDQVFHPVTIFVFHHQGGTTGLRCFEMNRYSGLLPGAFLILSKGAPSRALEADATHYQKP
jgi:hypothetical protein